MYRGKAVFERGRMKEILFERACMKDKEEEREYRRNER